MLSVVVPGYLRTPKSRWAAEQPFKSSAPGFFEYLRNERGLREASIVHYKYQLARLRKYLDRTGVARLRDLSPPVLGGFVTDCATYLCRTGVRDAVGTVRVFLRYLHREGIVAKDLSSCLESPRTYRLAAIPRSIDWDDVRRMLEAVDRRTAVGKRDYAILLLLITYGLRGGEVAAITLDDIDWRRDRLRIPERKAGHFTGYPLSPIVGAALLDYLRNARPETSDRALFFRLLAPQAPLSPSAVSSRATYYLRRAGITVRRAGSHTLRHSCVQRLVDADLPFKVIGDYVGHRVPESTEIYAKVAVESLREVALGHGEEIL